MNLVFLLAALCSGDGAKPPAAYPDSIVVVGEALHSRPVQTRQQVLDIERLERRATRDVSEALELADAANVTTNSRGETLVYLRNSAERQLAVLFDGAAINVPWDNRLDLALLPITGLEQIVVTPGLLSVRYGVNSAGGAIELVPASPREPGASGGVSAGAGSGEQRWADARLLARAGNIEFALAGEMRSRDGIVDPGGPGLLTNTDRARESAIARLAWSGANARSASAALLHIDSRFGIAPAQFDRPGQGRVRYWRYPENDHTVLILRGAQAFGPASLSATLWTQHVSQTIESYRSARYERLKDSQASQDTAHGVRLRAGLAFAGGDLHLGFNALQTRHDQTERDFGSGGEIENAERGIFSDLRTSANAEYTRRSGPFEYLLGASVDRLEADETGGRPPAGGFEAVNAVAGLSWTISPHWSVRASMARKHRFPTLRELYGTALDRFLPNPGLEAETIDTVEMSARFSGERLELEITPFYSEVTGTLAQRNVMVDGRRLRQRINLEGSRVPGLEARLTFALSETVELYAHALASEPRRLEETGRDGKAFLSERPELLARAGLVYKGANGLDLSAGLDHRGRAYSLTDEDVFQPLEVSTALELSAAWSPPEAGWQAFFVVRNATDTLIEPQLGLPAAGREIRAGLRVFAGG